MAAERAAGAAVKESTSRVATGALGDLANRVEAHLDRNEGSDRWRHLATVPVGKVAWLGLRYFTEPVDELRNELKDETGFDWLTDADFTGEIDPEACWRRPFTLAEIAEGYAIDRERPARDGGERENVTESLLDQLRDGGQRVVLGRPGSGKTTICKSVAHRWHEADDTGSVLYRKSGAGTFDDRPALFGHAVERAKARGPVLVVVEDAARRETVGFLETVKKYAGDSDVSFLLDSRVSEWRSGGETFREEVDVGLQDAVGKSVQSLVGGEIEQRRVPPLDEREVERVVERFTEKTGKPVRESPEEILERIRTREAGEDGSVQTEGSSVRPEGNSVQPEGGPVQSGSSSEAWPSPMLLLAYHLQLGDYAVDPEAVDADGSKSALRMNVEEAYEAVMDPVSSDHDVKFRGYEDLREQVGVLVNVLNAAGIGVRKELVHALAETAQEHDVVDGFLNDVEGLLHFGIDEGTRYYGPHQMWSMLYLEVLLERTDSEAQARLVFEAAVNALFSLVGDEERRETVREQFGWDVGFLSAIDENPMEVVDGIVSDVFDVGKERPKLVPLYGATEYSGLELPDSCSDETRAMCSLWRSQMYRVFGDREQAVKELEMFHDMESKSDVDSDWVNANYSLTLGNIALASGDFESARVQYQQSLEIAREVGNHAGEAKCLEGLGLVARHQGDYEAVREYHAQSLEMEREVGDRAGEASSLNNLGLAARHQGDYEEAQEYHQQSLEIFREVGHRAGEAKSLEGIGLVYEEHGRHVKASEYIDRASKIFQEIGALGDLLRAIQNLIRVNLELDNTDKVTEVAERGLTVIEESEISGLDEE